MGIRIDAYALDVSRFNVLLNMTLGESLDWFSQHVWNQTDPPRFNDNETHGMYWLNADGRFYQSRPAGSKREIGHDELFSDALLRRTLREHIEREPIYELRSILGMISGGPAKEFVRPVISGERRWWIGSVLQSAEAVCSNDELSRLHSCFGRLLAGYDCGYQIRHNPLTTSLPSNLRLVIPDDPDLRFSVWSDDDSCSITAILQKVRSTVRHFRRPPGPLGIAPREDEWSEWVHDILPSLIALQQTEFDELAVLTLIG